MILKHCSSIKKKGIAQMSAVRNTEIEKKEKFLKC